MLTGFGNAELEENGGIFCVVAVAGGVVAVAVVVVVVVGDGCVCFVGLVSSADFILTSLAGSLVGSGFLTTGAPFCNCCSCIFRR